MFIEQFLRLLWNVYKETFTEIHGGHEARIILISTTVAKFSFLREIEMDVFAVADPVGGGGGLKGSWSCKICNKGLCYLTSGSAAVSLEV